MPTAARVVHFYDTYISDAAGNLSDVAPGFWSDALDQVSGLAPQQRAFTNSGTDFWGDSRVNATGAMPYLYLGRLRYRDDWPDVLDANDFSWNESLPLSGASRLLEPTLLVPFGGQERVALINPIGGLNKAASAAAWVNSACGLSIDNRIQLRPVLDPDAAALFRVQSTGISRLEVSIPKGSRAPSTGGGKIGNATRAALGVGTSPLTLSIVWSLGHDRESDLTAAELQDGAEWILASDAASSLVVNMRIPDADGFRVVQRDLVEEKVTVTAQIELRPNRRPQIEDILSAVTASIAGFEQRMNGGA